MAVDYGHSERHLTIDFDKLRGKAQKQSEELDKLAIRKDNKSIIHSFKKLSNIFMINNMNIPYYYRKELNKLNQSYIDSVISKHGERIYNAISSTDNFIDLIQMNTYAWLSLIRVAPDKGEKFLSSKDVVLSILNKNTLYMEQDEKLKIFKTLKKSKAVLRLFKNINDLKDSNINKFISPSYDNTIAYELGILASEPRYFAHLFVSAEDVISFQNHDNHCRNILNILIDNRPIHFACIFKQANDFIRLAKGKNNCLFFFKNSHDSTFSAATKILKNESDHIASLFNNTNDLIALANANLTTAVKLMELQPQHCANLFKNAEDFIEVAKLNAPTANYLVEIDPQHFVDLFKNDLDLRLELKKASNEVSNTLERIYNLNSPITVKLK